MQNSLVKWPCQTALALIACVPVFTATPTSAQTTSPAAAVPATAAVPAVPGERKYTVNYKDNLLSIREDGGAYRFAQTLTAPTVKLRFEANGTRPGVKLSLQDDQGKTLWTNFLSLDETGKKYPRGTFNFKTDGDGGIKFNLTPEAPATTDDNQEPGDKVTVTALLRADNTFLSGDARYGKSRLHMQRLADGSGLTMTRTEDGTTSDTAVVRFDAATNKVTGTLNGQELLAVAGSPQNANMTFSDANGKIVLRNVKQDGKDYIEVQIGERRLLIEGNAFQAVSKDGVITVTPTLTAPAQATPPTNKP